MTPFNFTLNINNLSNFNISASTQRQFKMLTVSHSPPTTTPSDSRGAKCLGQSQKPTLERRSVVSRDRSDRIAVPANDSKLIRARARGPAEGTCGQIPFVLSYVNGIKTRRGGLTVKLITTVL